MAKYVRKPEEIEAVQLRWDTWGEMCDLLGQEFFDKGGRGELDNSRICLEIETAQGKVRVNEGEWVVRVNGKLVRCSEEVFEGYYLAVDSEKSTGLKIWECKIGEIEDSVLPSGSDIPMRIAVAKAYREVTGREPNFIFSGWGAELTEPQRAIVEDRSPRT